MENVSALGMEELRDHQTRTVVVKAVTYSPNKLINESI